MATTENSITLTLAYTNTDFERKYKLTNVQTSELSHVKERVLAYNANLPEDDKSIFISDDYDETQNIGKLKGIVAATYETVAYTRINLNEGDGNG